MRTPKIPGSYSPTSEEMASKTERAEGLIVSTIADYIKRLGKDAGLRQLFRDKNLKEISERIKREIKVGLGQDISLLLSKGGHINMPTLQERAKEAVLEVMGKADDIGKQVIDSAWQEASKELFAFSQESLLEKESDKKEATPIEILGQSIAHDLVLHHGKIQIRKNELINVAENSGYNFGAVFSSAEGRMMGTRSMFIDNVMKVINAELDDAVKKGKIDEADRKEYSELIREKLNEVN